MTRAHLEVVTQQATEQGQVLGVDGRMEAVAAEVDPLAGDLDAGRHAPDVVGGLDHDHLVTRPAAPRAATSPAGPAPTTTRSADGADPGAARGWAVGGCSTEC